MQKKAPSLPPLVGYAELEATYGWNKRTLQRWVGAGKLPRPTTTPGGRVAWLLAEMEAFIEQMHKGLTQAAVTDPSNLRPSNSETPRSTCWPVHLSTRLAGRLIRQAFEFERLRRGDVGLRHTRLHCDAQSGARYIRERARCKLCLGGSITKKLPRHHAEVEWTARRRQLDQIRRRAEADTQLVTSTHRIERRYP